MAKDYVQKYLWRDYGKPFSTAWQITLTADEAVVFLAMVAVLITYTQTRTWSLDRRVVIRLVRPIQLSDIDDPTSLLRLSQYEAMSRLVSDILAWRRGRIPSPSNGMTKTSPLFGIAAIANVTLFVVMGVLVPWLLTGGLETPVVQSRGWDGCKGNKHNKVSTSTSMGLIDHYYTSYTTNQHTDDINLYLSGEKYRQCWQTFSDSKWTASRLAVRPHIIAESCALVDGPILDRPPVHTTYEPDACGLENEHCVRGLSKFEVAHKNLTLRDYGINIKSELRHSRRLTCTPLDLQVFVQHKNAHSRMAPLKERQEKPDSDPFHDLRNPADNQSNHTPNLTLEVGGRFLECQNCEILHKYFQREGWDTFLVVVQNNNSDGTLSSQGQAFAVVVDKGYQSPALISLPYQFDEDIYPADEGFAMLMCQEQHQICHGSIPGRCIPYAKMANPVEEVFGALEDVKTIKELCAFLDIFVSTKTTTIHRGGEDTIHSPWGTFWPTPWTVEVIKWFEGAVLLQRLDLHGSITGRLQRWVMDPNAYITGQNISCFSASLIDLFCQSSLLLDTGYTSINFVGLMMTLVAMAGINTASHWRQLNLAAGRAALRLRRWWTKAARVWQGTVSSVPSSLASIRQTRAVQPERGIEQGSQIDLALRS